MTAAQVKVEDVDAERGQFLRDFYLLSPGPNSITRSYFSHQIFGEEKIKIFVEKVIAMYLFCRQE